MQPLLNTLALIWTGPTENFQWEDDENASGFGDYETFSKNDKENQAST